MPNIALLSTAHIHTKGFIENLVKGADGPRAYRIWDDIPERGQRYAALCGAKFSSDIDSVLADPDVDGFMICAENTRHLPLLRKALPVGKPVFCEKPLVTTVAELREVAGLIGETKLHCGYFQPFTGQMQAVAQMLGQNAFGKVTRCRFRNAH